MMKTICLAVLVAAALIVPARAEPLSEEEFKKVGDELWRCHHTLYAYVKCWDDRALLAKTMAHISGKTAAEWQERCAPTFSAYMRCYDFTDIDHPLTLPGMLSDMFCGDGLDGEDDLQQACIAGVIAIAERAGDGKITEAQFNAERAALGSRLVSEKKHRDIERARLLQPPPPPPGWRETGGRVQQ